jgi:hypothetical protein
VIFSLFWKSLISGEILRAIYRLRKVTAVGFYRNRSILQLQNLYIAKIGTLTSVLSLGRERRETCDILMLLLKHNF